MLPKGSRFFGWLIVVALCSAFVTAFAFASEIGCPRVDWAAFVVPREHVSASARRPLTERILVRLAERETREIDPWLRDDLRIAWITVLYASRGESSPHFWATYQVLGCSPEQVWPRIVANRKAMLGAAYAEVFPENGLAGNLSVEVAAVLPPKKSAQSVGSVRIRQIAKAAAA